MANLESILRCLKPEEATSLKGSNVLKFLESKYHNSQQSLIPYFKAVIKYYPEFKHRNYTPERVYRNVHSKKMYNKNEYFTLRADLKNKVEEYLAYENLKQEKQVMEELRINELSKRKAFKIFNSHIVCLVKKIIILKTRQ